MSTVDLLLNVLETFITRPFKGKTLFITRVEWENEGYPYVLQYSVFQPVVCGQYGA
jgi:hypothetical protein